MINAALNTTYKQNWYFFNYYSFISKIVEMAIYKIIYYVNNIPFFFIWENIISFSLIVWSLSLYHI